MAYELCTVTQTHIAQVYLFIGIRNGNGNAIDIGIGISLCIVSFCNSLFCALLRFYHCLRQYINFYWQPLTQAMDPSRSPSLVHIIYYERLMRQACPTKYLRRAFATRFGSLSNPTHRLSAKPTASSNWLSVAYVSVRLRVVVCVCGGVWLLSHLALHQVCANELQTHHK